MLLSGNDVSKGISIAPKLEPVLAGKATEFYINKE